MPVSYSSLNGWRLNRGTNVTITCEVASITKPTIILKKDRITSPAQQLTEVTNTTSGGTNLWHVSTSIFQFEDNDAAKYICETKFGTDIVQSRILYLNIQGNGWVVAPHIQEQELAMNYTTTAYNEHDL